MEPTEQYRKSLEGVGDLAFLAQTGSHAYGLATPASDQDYRGVFFPSTSYIVGLKTVEQIKVRGDDWVCHDVRQFTRLVIKQNPTILEMLYVDSLYEAPVIKNYFLALRGLITRDAFKPYWAYVQSQLEKAKYRQPTEKRKELIDKFGYDTKFMSHVARLAYQGACLQRTWTIPVMLPDPVRQEILAIKIGSVNFASALGYCESLEKDLVLSGKESILPETVDLDEFESEVYIPLIKSLIG